MKSVELVDGLLQIKFGGPDFRNGLSLVRMLDGNSFNQKTKTWTATNIKKNVDLLKKARFNFLTEVVEEEMPVSYHISPTPQARIDESLLHPDLFPYQKDGVRFLEAVNGNGMILDDMGTGKSCQSVSYLRYRPEYRPFLVICPASIKENWRRELKLWGDITDVQILSGKKAYPLRSSDGVIINYDILNSWVDELLLFKFRIVIIDESQKIANWKSLMAKATIALAHTIPHIVFLSGTPIRNRPREFWTTLALVDPDNFGNRWSYLQKYCLPGNAPILMSDLTEKNIDQILKGDIVIGWRKNVTTNNEGHRLLCKATVLDIIKQKSILQKIYLKNGDELIATPDHKWLNGRKQKGKYTINEYIPIYFRNGKVGNWKNSLLVKIFTTLHYTKESNLYKLGYITGAFHGDGWCSILSRKRYSPLRGTTKVLKSDFHTGISVMDREILDRLHDYLLEFAFDIEVKQKINTNMFSLISNTKKFYEFISSLQTIHEYDWYCGFLGGIYDTEGSGLTIAQHYTKNPITFNIITMVLEKLNIPFTVSGAKEIFHILGGRKGMLRFWELANPVLKRKLTTLFYQYAGRFMLNKFEVDRVETLAGEHDVYTLTTTTGNYVAYGYGSKNCDPKYTRFGWDFSGSSNIEELHARISPYMIRRLKEDVLTQLPPKQKFVVPLELDDIHAKEYDHANDAFKAWVLETKKKKGLELANKMETLRQMAYQAKRDSLISWIQDYLESGKKLVIFAYHVHVLDDLESVFGDVSVRVDGSVATEKRQSLVDAFQEQKKVKVFLGQMIASGVGITLTSASTVVFAEMWWVPADHAQCEDRIHRIGQKDNVQIYYLVGAGTVEVDMAERIIEKYKVIKGILDGDKEDEFFQDQILEDILKEKK